MAVTLDDFEELLHCKIANLSGLGWKAPLVQADFGGGYGAGIIANQDYGLHRWTIKSDFLPDNTNLVIGDNNDPYFTYFFEFVKSHILKGNKPFKIHEPRTDKYYLVRFVTDGSVNFARLTAKFFSFDGVEVVEARHADLVFASDGSLDIDLTPPGTISDLALSSKTDTTITAAFTTPTGGDIVGYQYRLYSGGSWGSWTSLSVTGTATKSFTLSGLSASTAYQIQVRAYDDASPINYATESNTLSVTTNASTSPVKINIGGSASSPFIADNGATGGTAYTYGNTIDKTGLTDPAPDAVYNSVRYSYSTFTTALTGLSPSTSYNFRIHSMRTEIATSTTVKHGATTKGTITPSGSAGKAVILEFSATSDGSGNITLSYEVVTGYAHLSGLEYVAA